VSSPTDRVCAVVVTFNRKESLRRTLDGLRAQSRPVDLVLVVVNRSTDGTLDMLAAGFPDVTVLELPGNFGGAGGFHAGVRWAHARGYDWFWLMDDDVAPLPEALEKQLGCAPFSGFIHCRRKYGDQPYRWDHLWDPSAASTRTVRPELHASEGPEWTCIRYGNFEGALVHRRVVDVIGSPDPRFFVGGDDIVYGLEASLHTRVVSLNYIGFERALPDRLGARLGFYIAGRNRFLIAEAMRRLLVDWSPFLFWVHVLYDAVRKMKHILDGFQTGSRWDNFRALWRGIADGARGRYGPPPWIGGSLEQLESYCREMNKEVEP
jgi:glycosyltransferase involved in cell wall biosynthesis